MLISFVIGISVLLQFVTVLFALRLIKVTGRFTAWIIISSALVLMEARRIDSLWESFVGNPSSAHGLKFELFGLGSSLLMLLGVVLISPLLKSIKHSEENQKKLAQELQDTLTRREQTEVALRESEEKYRELVENANSVILKWDTRGKVTFFNEYAERFFGFSKEEFIGRNVVGTIVPPSESTGRNLANLMEEICADPERFMDNENENITKDGRRVWLRWMNRAILDNSGKPVGVLSVGNDITGRKQAEEEKDRLFRRTEQLLEDNRHFIQRIEENRHFIQRIIDTTPNLIYIYDLLEQRNVFANREVAELLGFTKKEMQKIGSGFLPSIVHPDDIGLVNEHHKAFAAATDSDIFEIEYRVKDWNGQWRWLHSREVIFAKTPDGVAKQMLGIAEDITARKHDEEKLRFFSAAVEQAFDGVQIIDPAGNIFYSNKAIRHIYGHSPEELNGKNVSDLNVDPEISGRVILPSMMDTGKWSGELAVWHKNGHQFPVWLNASVIKNEHGVSIASIGIIRDITRRKEAEEALKKAYDELEIRVRERTAELSLSNAALEKEKQHIKITNTLLELVVQNVSRKEYLDAVVGVMQQWSNCRCVGIRILKENGSMPYESYVGYSQEFLDSENVLSVNKDQCACIRVITGAIEPQDLSVMTPYGSFYPDHYLEYMKRLPEFEKSRFLSACVRSRFESVAIVPISYQEKVIGAIHLADEKEGGVTFDKVLFAEKSAILIGEAIYRFNAEENLRKSQEQLRNLTAYLQEIRENERTIIAREIHDELGQIMTALKIDLSWIKDKYKNHEALTEKTKSMLALIDTTIQTVKKIITDLRPGILDHLGISAAIEWQADEFQKVTGIPSDVLVIPEEITLSKDLTTNIFRIFQEILTNVARHAQATHLTVLLEENDGKIILNVKDNGKGITEEQISNPSSFGIMGIRERVNFLGGSFKITGISQRGSEITIIIPLDYHSLLL